jgi:hypothetical protein
MLVRLFSKAEAISFLWRQKSILKETDIHWRERNWTIIFYMDYSFKVKLEQRKTKYVKTGREVRQGCFCHRLY